MTATDLPLGGTVPRMSVVLVTDCQRTIRPVLQRFREQTVRDRLELVVVMPSKSAGELDRSAFTGFAGVQLVTVDSIFPLASARAAGVLASTAPVVAIGETHAFPQPNWAEALIKAHEQPWAVVVPAFDNANPDTPLSWGAFLRDYGLWVRGLPAREIEFVPPYNTATKRDVLLRLDGGLDRMVSRAEELEKSLRAGGHRNYFEPAAIIDHANMSQPKAWLLQRFLLGREFASRRTERWSRPRLLLYACAAPLIPAVILTRLIRPLHQVQQNKKLPGGTVLALIVGAIVSAAGELIAYAFAGGANTKLRLDQYELYKLRYTSLRDH